MFKKVIKAVLIYIGVVANTPIIAQTPISTTFTGTPASCVITYPFSNAYFQSGSVIPIRIYASDQGGSSAAGSVTRVEIFNGNTYLGSVTSGTNNTFTYNYNCAQTGTFILKARAVDNSGNVSGSAGVKVVIGVNAPTPRGLSTNKGKYLANIIAGSVPQNYNTYWNGVTAENDCKWGSVERSRDVMTWTGADRSFNHAKNNNMMFRYHALAWGNQYPCWAITGQGCSGAGGSNSGTPTLQISAADFQAELEEYMAAVAARYGDDIDQLDVLNENLQFGNGGEHAPATGVFRQALGGAGTSGYDWVIWLFTRARKYFPNSKLILNDYGLENDQSAINRQLAVIRVLRDRNLIDGFGTQAHEFNINTLSATQLRNALDLMDNSGVPTYVTELDISGTDQEQLQRYQNLLPEYWNHPSVAGITLWGYIEGQTWIANTGLVSSGNNNPTESPAMQYIKSFVSGRTNVNYPFGTIQSPSNCGTVTSSSDYSMLESLAAYPNPFGETFTINCAEPFKYQVYNGMGKLELSGTSTNNITLGESLSSGLYTIVVERDTQKEFIKIAKK